MKKNKGWFFVLFVIILSILLIWAFKTSITAAYLSKKMKTQVTISNMNIDKSQLILNGFKLKNPKKTKAKYAFRADKIIINFSFSKLFSSPSIIDNILLEKVNLDIECTNPLCTKNNWTRIVDNINKNEQKKETKELIVKNLIIKDMEVLISGLGLDFFKTKTTHIDQLEFKDISSKKGFPTQQLIAAIFRSAGLKDYLKGIIETKNMIENIIDTFKSTSEASLEGKVNEIKR